MARRPEPMTCLLCGIEDRDVMVMLVEVEHPERTVKVPVPVNNRDGSVEMMLEVPERFYAVPRCRDRAACRERELLATPGEVAPAAEPVVEPEPIEDPMAWL